MVGGALPPPALPLPLPFVKAVVEGIGSAAGTVVRSGTNNTAGEYFRSIFCTAEAWLHSALQATCDSDVTACLRELETAPLLCAINVGACSGELSPSLCRARDACAKAADAADAATAGVTIAMRDDAVISAIQAAEHCVAASNTHVEDAAAAAGGDEFDGEAIVRMLRNGRAPSDPKLEIYCLCQRPDTGGYMTHCSHCDTWLHAACAGVRGGAARRKLERLKGDTFMCSRCCTARGLQYTFLSGLPVASELLVASKMPLPQPSEVSAPKLEAALIHPLNLDPGVGKPTVD